MDFNKPKKTQKLNLKRNDLRERRKEKKENVLLVAGHGRAMARGGGSCARRWRGNLIKNKPYWKA